MPYGKEATMPDSILSKTARDKLKPRREPYWSRIAAGQHVGYRKTAAGEGSWIARFRDAETEKREIRSLGTIVDTDDRRAYDLACDQARAWFKELELGVDPEAKTVGDACRRYAESFGEKRDPRRKRAEQDFARLVIGDPIERIQLHRARETHFKEWRERMVAAPARVGRSKKIKDSPRSPGTINRDLVSLRAAMNYALSKHWISTAIAWREALAPLAAAEVRNPRDVYLTRPQRRALLDAAKTVAPAFEPFLLASTLLPVRPGALAALAVRAFDARTGTVAIGEDKGHAPRTIKLSPQALAVFKAAVRDKLPGAPIFAQPHGSAWDKNAWAIAMRSTVATAKLPAGVTLYHVRHAVLSDLVQDTDLPLLSIAKLAGTSVRMIEDTYAKLRHDRAADALATLAV
jgi:site-specific recombinase XerD